LPSALASFAQSAASSNGEVLDKLKTMSRLVFRKAADIPAECGRSSGIALRHYRQNNLFTKCQNLVLACTFDQVPDSSSLDASGVTFSFNPAGRCSALNVIGRSPVAGMV
jgi:hypothetical protein